MTTIATAMLSSSLKKSFYSNTAQFYIVGELLWYSVAKQATYAVSYKMSSSKSLTRKKDVLHQQRCGVTRCTESNQRA